MKYKYSIFILSIILFFLLIKITPPTIFLGDGGETVSASYVLGIQHPPGYPLYTLSGKIFTFINIGDVGFRVNLLAVLFTILVFIALNFLFCEFIELTNKKIFIEKQDTIKVLAIIISLLYIFSYDFLSQAIHAKGGIYILNQLLICLSLISVMKYIINKNSKYFYLSLYISGFLPAIHHTGILVMFFNLVIILYIYLKEFKLNKVFFKGIFLFALSFITPYIYFFIRTNSNSLIVWQNIKGFDEIIKHILRFVYFKEAKLPLTFESLFFKIKTYILLTIKDFNVITIFFLYGLFKIWRTKRKIFYIIFSFILSNLLILILVTSNGITNEDIYMNSPFYLVNHIVFILVAFSGSVYITLRLKKIMVFVLIILLVITGKYNLEKNNNSKNIFGYTCGVDILNNLQSEDFLFTKKDYPSFNLLYLQTVKNKYKNIKIYDMDACIFDLSIYEQYKSKLNNKVIEKIIFEYYKKHPENIFLTEEINYINEKIFSIPYGIVFKLTDKKINNNLIKNIFFQSWFYNKKVFDYFHKGVISKYFLKYSLFFFSNGNYKMFEKNINIAEKIGEDNWKIMKLIAYIYYNYVHNIDKTIYYLKKEIKLNPLDKESLRVLVGLNEIKKNYSECLIYLNMFYKREKSPEKRILILKKKYEILNKMHKRR